MAITSFKPDNNRFRLKDGLIQPPKTRIRVMVSLDALLDTRLGLIHQKFPEAMDTMQLGTFTQREIDGFSWCPPTDFRTLWDARDDEVLAHAYMTGIYGVLWSILEGAYQDSLEQPFTNRALLIVDLAPYTFSTEEQESLKEALTIKFGHLAEIKFIRVGIEKLSVAYIRQNFEVMVLYEFSHWLHTHQAEFTEKDRLPFVKCFAPRLFYEKLPSSSEYYHEGRIVDPFEELRKVMLPLLDVMFIHAEVFSILTPSLDEALAQANSQKLKNDIYPDV